MRKLIAAFALFVSSCVPAPAWDLKEMNAHIDETNFIVGSGCSGTLIDLEERLILTNHHCITQYLRTKTEKVTVDGVIVERRVTDYQRVPLSQREYVGHELVSERGYVSEIEAFNETTDLALLQMRVSSLPQTREAEIYQGDLLRGETVYVVGNPLRLENTVMKGIISSTNRLLKVGREEIPYIQVDAGITGGNSGGSLYNDEGLLIGVPGAAARGTVVGLAIPNTFIIEFLEDNCWASVFDPEAESYEECMAEEE